MLPVAVAVAMVGFIGAFGAGSVPTAQAFDGDICAAYVGSADGAVTPVADFDGQGNDVYVVQPDTEYGLVFRVEDILTGWYALITEYENVDGTVGDVLEELAFAGVLPGPNVDVEVDSETGSARLYSKAEAYNFDSEREGTAGGVDFDDIWLIPDITHTLINGGVINQTVQTFNPRWFNNSSGFALDNINDWLNNPAGMSSFADADYSVCGASSGGLDPILEIEAEDGGPYTDVEIGGLYPGDDAWGYVDFMCIEPGYFHIDMRADDLPYELADALIDEISEALEDIDADQLPQNLDTPEEILEAALYWNMDPAHTGKTLKFFCGGTAESAEISARPSTVEIVPVGSSRSESTITVTVEDKNGDRVDNIWVALTTDNCTFDQQGSSFISPAGGGTSVDIKTDTDAAGPDQNFLNDNPGQAYAGTAEAILDCSRGNEGVATVKATVQRPGSDIQLETEVTVVGQTSATGLSLTLNPDDLECGNEILATAVAVDSENQPVSDGTVVYFTTDTSAGVVGGIEGAQGGKKTVDGEASVIIATDPGNPGTHTVIAYTINAAGTVDAQTSATYVCDAAVAPAAPTVAPPSTGTGSITPPNTGDAGLAAGSTSNAGLFVIAGAVALALAGVASVRFARN